MVYHKYLSRSLVLQKRKNTVWDKYKLFNVESFTLEVMYATYPKRDLHNILPLLKVFLKSVYTLYTFYNTLANISIIFHEHRPLESSRCSSLTQSILWKLHIASRHIKFIHFTFYEWSRMTKLKLVDSSLLYSQMQPFVSLSVSLDQKLAGLCLFRLTQPKRAV